MQHTKQITDHDFFADVLAKIKSLSASQQKFIQAMIVRREESAPASKKKLLKKSFGIWAERTDLVDSEEYISTVRKGWGVRLERFRH